MLNLDAIKYYLVSDMSRGILASQKVNKVVPRSQSSNIPPNNPSRTSNTKGTIVPPSVRIDQAMGKAMYWDIFTSQYYPYTPISRDGQADRELRFSGPEYPASLDWDIFTSQYKPVVRNNQ